MVVLVTRAIHRYFLADDAAPVVGAQPVRPSPFLLTSDHFGRAIPEKLGDLGLPASELTRHIAWDIGIAGVARALSAQLDAHLIAQHYSRLVIDCNRPFASPSSIPLISEATTISGNEGLTREGVEARRREVFDPYHRRIAEVIDQRLRDGASRPCCVAAQLHAGLCRHQAALACRHALSARHPLPPSC